MADEKRKICPKCGNSDCPTKGEPVIFTCYKKNCLDCKRLQEENNRKSDKGQLEKLTVEVNASDDFLHIKKPKCQAEPMFVCGSGNRPGSTGKITIIEDYFSKPSSSSENDAGKSLDSEVMEKPKTTKAGASGGGDIKVDKGKDVKNNSEPAKERMKKTGNKGTAQTDEKRNGEPPSSPESDENFELI